MSKLSGSKEEQKKRENLFLSQVHTGCEVVSVGREGKSKGEFSREGKSFRLLVEGDAGKEEWLKDFQAVVDCTGTYGQGR